MFKFPKRPDRHWTEKKAIADCYTRLAQLDPETDDYEKVLTRIDNLQAQIQMDKKLKSKLKMPSPDAMFTGAISIASILLVLNYERLDVVTSKAFGMINKPKI